MSIMQLLITAFIATGHMTLVYWLLVRLGLAKGRFRPTIRSFTIPERSHTSFGTAMLHILAGILFTGVYAYILLTPRNETFGSLVGLGTAIGLVHGFFLDFFVLLGFSGLKEVTKTTLATLEAMLLTLGSHMIFGTLVGVGVASRTTTTTWVDFVTWGLASIAFWVVLGALLPQAIAFIRSRHKAPKHTQPLHKKTI